MSLIEKINSDFLTAFKDKQDTKVSVLRMLKSALINKGIEKKIEKGSELPDEDALAVIKSEIKKRKDSCETYKQANRNDLAEKEQAEIDILNKYIPEQMTEDQIRKIVISIISKINLSGLADFGKVMGLVMSKASGQADGNIVSKIVKEELQK